jgi:CBS-domain-containing membrane protein
MTKLSLRALSSRGLHIPGADPWHAAPDDPALTVMTDFRERASVTVAETATIDAALEHMKHNGVRCAFAIDETRRAVVGLITAYDIMSEKPMRHMQAAAIPRREVHVRDVMHSVSDWQVLDIKDIERATVAAVSRLFDETGLTHVPVMETGESGEQHLRGLLSGAKVRRLLSQAPMHALARNGHLP